MLLSEIGNSDLAERLLQVSDQIVDIAEYCLSYLLAVAASFGADGAAFVKKGVISSISAT